MDEFFAAIIGALFGGAFAFLANYFAAERAAKDAQTHWQRDKRAEVLELFIGRSRSLVRSSSSIRHKFNADDFFAVNLGEALNRVRLWAPDFANQAANVYAAWWRVVKDQGTSAEALDLTKELEERIRDTFGLGTLPPVELD